MRPRYDVHPLTHMDVAILRRTRDGPIYAGQLLHEQILDASTQIPYSVLWRLEGLGLETSEAEGNRRMYSLTEKGARILAAWEAYCAAWDDDDGAAESL